jgi:hypothetical protein
MKPYSKYTDDHHRWCCRTDAGISASLRAVVEPTHPLSSVQYRSWDSQTAPQEGFSAFRYCSSLSTLGLLGPLGMWADFCERAWGMARGAHRHFFSISALFLLV